MDVGSRSKRARAARCPARTPPRFAPGHGLDASGHALASVAEHRASFPAFTGAARGNGDLIFPNFDSRSIPTAQNRYTGQNLGAYANPALQQLIESLYATIDQQGQARVLRDAGDILAADLPALPLYFRAEFMTVARGVRAVQDDYATAQSGAIARNVHLWDRD